MEIPSEGLGVLLLLCRFTLIELYYDLLIFFREAKARGAMSTGSVLYSPTQYSI
jgi:hypothetical protein